MRMSHVWNDDSDLNCPMFRYAFRNVSCAKSSLNCSSPSV